ncbi:MAG: hypothetical protein IM568_11760 [Flavobacterium sp.]|nr:hypothetical protein [Flavobacterium sp.]
MKKRINLNAGHFIVLIVCFLIIYFSTKDILAKNEIREKGKEIVVKFTSKTKLPKTTNFYFTYFIDKKKVTTANSGISYSILNSDEEEKNIDNLKINSFYLAKYIPDYPNVIIVDPTKQITDTAKILESGFSKNDINK